MKRKTATSDDDRKRSLIYVTDEDSEATMLRRVFEDRRLDFHTRTADFGEEQVFLLGGRLAPNRAVGFFVTEEDELRARLLIESEGLTGGMIDPRFKIGPA